MLVDEVLSVGDAEFQARCLGRMEDINTTGRTVVFVSHQMQAVAQLCDRVLLIDEGRIVRDGPSAEVVAHYLQSATGTSSSQTWSDEEAPGDDLVRLHSVRAVRAGRRDGGLRGRARARRHRADLQRAPRRPAVLSARSRWSRAGRSRSTRWTSARGRKSLSQPGDYVTTAWIPGNFLNEGLVTVDAAVCSIDSPKLHHHVSDPRGGLVPRAGPARGRLVARARSRASGAASSGRCSTGRPRRSERAGRRGRPRPQRGRLRRAGDPEHRGVLRPHLRGRPSLDRPDAGDPPPARERARPPDGPALERRGRLASRRSRRYAGTPTWAFGVDGDELYDPAALERPPRGSRRRRPRGRLPAEGPRAELHRARRRATVAKGYLAPPSRPVTKLFNMAAVEQLDRMPRAAPRRRGGVPPGIRLGLAPVPLRRDGLGLGSAADAAHLLPPALERGPGRRHAAFGAGLPETGAYRRGWRGLRAQASAPQRYIDPRIKEYQRSGSGWKQEWYARGPVVDRRRATVLRPTARLSPMRSRHRFPPRELAERVGAAPRGRSASYEEVGRSDPRRDPHACCPTTGRSTGSACSTSAAGPGRTLRHFLEEAESGTFYGCDIDAPSIAWLESNLSPPLHVFTERGGAASTARDGSLDLIWAISVFTHISDHWAAWLVELHRLLRDDGLLIATILGPGLSEEWAPAAPDPRSGGASHVVGRGGPNRNERPPLRTLLGSTAARRCFSRAGGSRSTGVARSRSSRCDEDGFAAARLERPGCRAGQEAAGPDHRRGAREGRSRR